MKAITIAAFSAFSLCAACTSTPESDVVITEIDPAALPASVTEAIATERPGFEAEEALKKVRDGRVYYDVEGEDSDGSEIEFDVLMQDDGSAQIVEIQRDLDWADVPSEVRDLAFEASEGQTPVRTIESLQTDGAVIYEFFAEGVPADPTWEIRVHGGEVELLTERWVH